MLVLSSLAAAEDPVGGFGAITGMSEHGIENPDGEACIFPDLYSTFPNYSRQWVDTSGNMEKMR
jgi:hypothetical protein